MSVEILILNLIDIPLILLRHAGTTSFAQI